MSPQTRNPGTTSPIAPPDSLVSWDATHGPRALCKQRLSVFACIMLAAVAVCLGPPSASAQSPTTTESKLGPILARYPGEFTQVISVRELADGSIMVVDEKDETVAILREGAVAPEFVSLRGRGPGEAWEMSRVWPLAADTSIMKDHSLHRLLLFVGARVVATLGAFDPLGRLATRERLIGADGRGGLYYSAFRRDGRDRADIYDSTLVLRVDRARLTVDTVATLNSGFSRAVPSRAEAASGPRGAPRYSMEMEVPDQVAVFPDGTIAIARTNPYRVDWCLPKGTCRIGSPIAANATDYSVVDKKALLDLSEAQATWPPTTRVDETVNWPAIRPPFRGAPWARDFGAVLAVPTGELLVLRTPTASAPGMSYDVIDRARGLIGTITIPSDERIVAFGRGAVYIAMIAPDGIQRIVRRLWR